MARLVIEVGQGAKAKAAVDAVNQSLAKLGGSAKVLNGDLKSLDRQSSVIERRYQSLARSLDPAIAKQHQLARATQTLSRALQQGAIDQATHDRMLTLATRKFGEAAGGASSLGASLSKLSGVIGGLSLAVLGQQLISTIASFETLRARLETVTGSSQAAAAAFDLITEFAKTTPFSVQEITDSFVRLQAQGITPTEEVLRSFGNTAAAMGKTFNQFAEAVLDAQTGEFERLKEFGIKAKSAGDQVTFTFRGVSTTVQKESSAIVGYLQQIGETDFAGAMERQSHTLAGQFSNLKDNVSQLSDALGQAGLAGSMGEALQAANVLVGGLTKLVSLVSVPIPEGGVKSFLSELMKKASVLGAASSAINDIAEAIRKLSGEGGGGEAPPPFMDPTAWAAARAELAKLEAGFAKMTEQGDGWEAAMDAATDRMLEQAAAAEKLAEETRKARENLVAMSHIEALPIAPSTADPRYLTAGGASVPANLDDEYQTYLKMLGVLSDFNSEREQLNRLVEQGVISEQQAVDALRLQRDGLIEIKDAATEVNSEWERFVEMANENFLRGVQGALSGFFVEVLQGGEDAMDNLVDSLKNLLFNMLAEYLAQWVVLQGKMLAASLARIAKEKAAQTAAGAVGGGGGGAGSYASLLGGGGGGGAGLSSGATAALAGVAIVVAVAALSKMQKDKANKLVFGTEVTAGLNQLDNLFSEWRGKLTQTGQLAADTLRGLLEGLQEATGVFAEGMEQIKIRIRNDKKSFEAWVGTELVGVYSDLNKAIIEAVKEAFLGADLSRELDPAIRQAIEGYRGNDPEELIKNIQTIRQVLDEIAGLTDIEVSLRDLPRQADALAASLYGMGVSIAEATRLSGQWRATQMQALRDQITGHQQTAAEERAEKERQAAMFNSELALMRAELEAKKASLEARLALVQGDAQLGVAEVELAEARVASRARILQAEGELFQAEAEMAQGFVQVMGGILGASAEMIQQQIAAIDQILASLPKPIDFGEIKLGGSGKGAPAVGGYSGPSKADRREDLTGQIDDLVRGLLPDFVQELLSLEERFAALRAEAEALGMSTEQLAALEAAYREQLSQRAQQEVGQYTGDPWQQQLDEILAWGAEMREVYAALGLALDEVEAAERARLEALGQQALAALGSPTAATIAQFQQLAQALAFLQANAAALGLSAEQVAQAMAEAGAQMAMSLVDSLLQFVNNEEARMQLEQLRYQMEIANIKLQFELLKAMGLLTEDMIALIQGLIDGLPDAPPATGGGGDGLSPTQKLQQMGQGESRLQQIRDRRQERMLEAIQELIDVVTAIRDFQEQMLRDERLAALTTEQQYLQAQQEFLDLQAAAMTGDLEAMAALPEAAEAYLLLAQEMFGSATMGYQQIFQQVYDLLEAVSALYPEGEDPDEWLKSDMQSVLDYLDGIKQAIVDGLRAAGPGAGPSMGGGSPGTSPGEVPPLLGTGFLGWQPPGGPPPPGPNPPQTESGTAQLAQGLAQLSQQVATLAASQDKAAKTMTQAVTLQPTSTSGLTKTSAPGATGGKKVA